MNEERYQAVVRSVLGKEHDRSVADRDQVINDLRCQVAAQARTMADQVEMIAILKRICDTQKRSIENFIAATRHA
jgi:hypothetical protein